VGRSVLGQDAKGSEKQPPALRGDNWQPEGKQGKLSARDFGLLVALSIHSAVRISGSPYNTRMIKKRLCNALATHRIQLAHTPFHRIVVPSSTSSVTTTSRLRQDRASMTAERHQVSLSQTRFASRARPDSRSNAPASATQQFCPSS
jgi:hypothetical protein